MPDDPAGTDLVRDLEILNHALEMANDLCASAIQSVRHRLHWHYPRLSGPELDAYDSASQDARDHAYGLVREFWRDRWTVAEEEEARAAWTAVVRERHPWISPRNLRGLWGVGCHFWK
jgi:hypothetical protein